MPAVSFSPGGGASASAPPGAPDGGGEPVQTGGAVPGWVATGSLGLHALATGTTSAAAASRRNGTEIGMPESLAGDRHDDARRLLGKRGCPRLDRGLQELAHCVGGFPLTRSL